MHALVAADDMLPEEARVHGAQPARVGTTRVAIGLERAVHEVGPGDRFRCRPDPQPDRETGGIVTGTQMVGESSGWCDVNHTGGQPVIMCDIRQQPFVFNNLQTLPSVFYNQALTARSGFGRDTGWSPVA